jgi:hypothetical protein
VRSLIRAIVRRKGPRRGGAVPSDASVGSVVLLLGALVITAAVAGCGGGDGDEPPPISRSAFVEKGSAICVSTRQGIRSDFEAFTKGSEGQEVARAERAGELTPEEAAARVGEKIIIPAMRQELEEFRALGIPPGDSDKVTALLETFEEGVKKAEKSPERAAASGTEAFGESGRVAAAYGLEGC